MSPAPRAIVRACNERPDDVRHVLEACRQAGVEPLLVWQGPAADPITRLIADRFEVSLWPRPLGMGGATLAGLRRVPVNAPVVVVDGDLWGLEPRTVATAAEGAMAGFWTRPMFEAPGAGRVGHRLAAAVRALGLPVPAVLDHGGLLAPVAGYPSSSVLLASSGVTGYGFDLDVALRYLIAFPEVLLGAFPAGQREHRPGGADHCRAMLAENLTVAAGWVRW